MSGQNGKFDRVKPGGLVTHILLNEILDQLEAFDIRISALEALIIGGTSATITSLIPPGSLRIGQEIQVIGRNLGFLAGKQRVFLDNTNIDTFKAGSNDSKLIFDIPDLPSIPAAGRQVVLTVANQFSSDSRTLLVLPAIHGSIDVTWVSVTPVTPTPGQPATFRFHLHSRADLSAVYAINATISIPEWNNLLQILDDSLNVLSTPQIQVDPGKDKDFFVRITSVPSGTTSTIFSLTVGAQAGAARGSSGSVGFDIGQPAETLDTSISFITPTAIIKPDPSGGTFNSPNIQLKQGFQAIVSLFAVCTVAGTYNTTITPAPPTLNWTAALPADQLGFTVTPQALQAQGGKVNQPIIFKVQPDVGASTTGQAELRVRRTDLTISQVIRFPLQLLS